MKAVVALVPALCLLASGCENGALGPFVAAGGLQRAAAGQLAERSAERGGRAIADFGCGTCHTIPGVRGADGKVAPPLSWFARRSFIAGQLPNTPENLVRWLKDPPAVEPGTAMPALGLTDAQARDIATYLHTLK